MDGINRSFLDYLVRNKVTPIIGAGVSRNADIESNLTIPDWEGLGQKFAILLNDGKNYSDPTECISEYVKKNNKKLMIQYLYDFLYMDKIRPGKVHKLLAKLPLKTIITTNFDNLIEQSFPMDTKIIKVYDSDDFLLRRNEDLKLIKLHGDFDRISTIIITKEDYENVGDTSLYRNNLKGLIFQKSLLLIGYSYRDPDLLKLIDEINSDIEPFNITIFSLLINPKASTLERFEGQKTIPIVIRNEEASTETILVELLEQLVNYVQVRIENNVTKDNNVKQIKNNPSRFVHTHLFFIGREQEIETIKESISRNKFVSIAGQGGIGKTSLSLKVLSKLKNEFFIIPLDVDKLDFKAMLVQISSDIGIVETDENNINKHLSERGNILIFIDNFEKISNDIDNSLSYNNNEFYSFLQSVPSNVKVLISSRNRRNIDGEVIHVIKGLKLSEGKNLFNELAQSTQFDTSKSYSDKLENIIEQIEGLPLGIKLLAGAYHGGGVKELDTLFKKFHMLSQENEDKNKISLEECYHYSINALSKEQKELLGELIRLKSPFNKNLFEYVFSRYEYPLLLELLNRNLLTAIQFGKQEEDIFFDFHPVLKTLFQKEFGKKEIDNDSLIVNLSNYYYDFLDDLYKHRKDPQKYSKSIKILNHILRKQDNDIESILEYPISIKFRSYFANLLVLIFLEFHYLSKALIINDKCMDWDFELDDNFRIANDYRNTMVIYAMANDYKGAIEAGKNAVDYYWEDNRADKVCAVYVEMVTLYLKDNKGVEADRIFARAKDIMKSKNVKFTDYDDYLSYKHTEYYVYFKSNKFNEALAILDEVLGASGKYDVSPRDLASFHQNRGLTEREQGNYEEAYNSFVRAFRIYEYYDDVSKKFQISRLILGLLKIWNNLDDYDIWSQKKDKAEKTMKERGIQFSQHEML